MARFVIWEKDNWLQDGKIVLKVVYEIFSGGGGIDREGIINRGCLIADSFQPFRKYVFRRRKYLQ